MHSEDVTRFSSLQRISTAGKKFKKRPSPRAESRGRPKNLTFRSDCKFCIFDSRLTLAEHDGNDDYIDTGRRYNGLRTGLWKKPSRTHVPKPQSWNHRLLILPERENCRNSTLTAIGCGHHQLRQYRPLQAAQTAQKNMRHTGAEMRHKLMKQGTGCKAENRACSACQRSFRPKRSWETQCQKCRQRIYLQRKTQVAVGYFGAYAPALTKRGN